MKYIDINKKYTEKVAEFLAQGYTINTATMNGTQGEVAHIDLTDGKKIIRVLLEGFNEFAFGRKGFTIKAGIAEESVKPNTDKEYRTLWNNRMTELYSERYYEVGETRTGEKWYGSKEEAEDAWDKRFGRYEAHEAHGVDKKGYVDLTNVAREIGVKAISRHTGTKKPNKAKVKVVHYYNSDSKYVVYYGDKRLELR